MLHHLVFEGRIHHHLIERVVLLSGSSVLLSTLLLLVFAAEGVDLVLFNLFVAVPAEFDGSLFLLLLALLIIH